MPLLIDGHNLIGCGELPGISLADGDDEPVSYTHLTLPTKA